jgi:hypothetical protein
MRFIREYGMIVMRMSGFLAVVFLTGVAAYAQELTPTLPPYPLTADITRSFGEIAAQSDLLILGEFHGTEEVPALAVSLLTPLTKLGYNVLALEVPSDQQARPTAWATVKTAKVPSLFTRPSGDGRANIQLLTLIRTALIDNPLSALWRSFAAVLQRDHPAWKVGSVNIRFHSGGFFNGGKVNTIKEPPLDKAVLRPIPDGDWEFELDLPHATSATFLAPPVDHHPMPTKK